MLVLDAAGLHGQQHQIAFLPIDALAVDDGRWRCLPEILRTSCVNTDPFCSGVLVTRL